MPRLAFLGRVLLLLVYPVLTVAVGLLVIYRVDQAQELVQAYLDEGEGSQHVLLHLLAHAMWGLSAWYCARVLLGKRFPVDMLGNCSGGGFARGVVTWLPRLLAVAATLPTAVFFFSERKYVAAAIWLAWTLLLFGFLVLRRSLPGLRAGVARSYSECGCEQWPHFDRLPLRGWVLMLFLGCTPWLVMAGVLSDQAAITRWLGAPAVLLLALTGWTVFGSMVLVYLPLSRGHSSMAWLPLLLFVVFSPFNDNHVVGQREGLAAVTAEPPAVAGDFDAWQAQRVREGRGGDPIYLVAMSGGASRAAYWGAWALGRLDDDARAQGRAFVPDIYALSGVSGGSLGASAFVGALAGVREAGIRAAAQGQPAPAPSLAGWMHELLGRDDLSPLLGYMLYPDLVARLLPFPVQRFDRGRGLERSWESDTQQVAGRQLGFEPPPWFALPMSDLHRLPAACSGATQPALVAACARPLPHLILNSASAVSGQPVLQSTLKLLPHNAITPADEEVDVARLSLSGAVHNSSRFPFISPAGQVRGRGPLKDEAVDWWVDGGYFENSGTASLQQLLREIRESAAVQRDPALLRQLRVIVFTNDPIAAGAPEWLPDLRAAAASAAEPASAAQAASVASAADHPTHPPRFRAQSSFLMELFAPPMGLYQTRGARSAAETFRLARLLRDEFGVDANRAVYEIRLPATGAEAPSMNWYVNPRSTCVMRSYLQGRDECAALALPGRQALPDGVFATDAYRAFRTPWDRLRSEVLQAR